MSRLTTRLYTAFFGRRVGTDSVGNRYFQNKRHRWVLYTKLAEPSYVTPEWHGWLHRITDVPPTESAAVHKRWERAPQPNFTGTPKAYLPAGHLLKGGAHAQTSAQYEPWVP